MNRILIQAGVFVVYLIVQVVVFNHFTLFDAATPHFFLLFLLMLPITIRYSILILISFFAGLAVDLLSFNFVKGIHAFACVLMMSVRLPLVNIITNRMAFRGNEETLLRVQPTIWYVQYLLPLIFIHHTAYYMLEAFSFDNFGWTMVKIISSTFFTFALCMMGTMLIYKPGRR